MSAAAAAAALASTAATPRALAIADVTKQVARENGWTQIRLHTADVQVLLDTIAELCPETEHCEFCEKRMCEACGLGASASCEAGAVHCDDCLAACTGIYGCANILRDGYGR